MVEEYNGVRISYPEDCGNAPKKKILAGFYIALANEDDKYIFENTSDNLLWEIVGNETIDEKNKMFNRLRLCRTKGIKEIKIMNVITHGNVCAVNGEISFIDESCVAFCDVFKFNGFGRNAKVKEIYSYIIGNK